MDYKYNCRVCGLYQDERIYGQDGNCPTFNICSCCGVEFGYEDTTLENCQSTRRRWILHKKQKWWAPKEKPKKWQWEEQKKGIPSEFKDTEQ